MSTRKVLVDLSRKISRASISKAKPRTSVRSLFTTEKLEIKDKNVDSVPEKFTTSTERWDNQPRSDLPLDDTTTNHQPVTKQLDLRVEVLKNMENGRFSHKVITAPIPNTYAETSIAGSDVFIAWRDDTRWSFSDPIVRQREIYDTKTDVRQKLPTIEYKADVITPSFIVSRESKGGWKIQNRSTNETKTVILPYYPTKRSEDIPDLATQYMILNEKSCRPNLDLTTETVLINEYDFDRFFVINLETGQVQEIKRAEPADDPIYDVQLHGTLVAYRENYRKPILRVIDIVTGKEILNFECPVFSEFYLLKDKIALAEIDVGKISWSIIDLNGKTIKQGTFETSVGLDKFFGRNVFAYKNFLIINQGPFLHFIDISTGKLLTSLLAHRTSGYKIVSGYDEGKFIITTDYTIQVVDFESPDPSPDLPVKAVVINPNETISTRTGTINELVNGIVYSEDWKPSKAATSSDKFDTKFEQRLSRTVHLSATQRITAVLFEEKIKGAIVRRLLYGHRVVVKKPHEYNYEVRPLSHVKKNFYGRGLLYKEELVDGKWVPVDLSVQQAEEFIKFVLVCI